MAAALDKSIQPDRKIRLFLIIFLSAAGIDPEGVSISGIHMRRETGPAGYLRSRIHKKTPLGGEPHDCLYLFISVYVCLYLEALADSIEHCCRREFREILRMCDLCLFSEFVGVLGLIRKVNDHQLFRGNLLDYLPAR